MASLSTVEHTLDSLTISSQETGREESVFVDRLVSNPIIIDCILSFCTSGTIFRISRTCSSSRLAILSYLQRAFNINRHLSCYFSDPIGFRLVQSRTGTIISGSNALQFLDRSFYPESDLDVYVPWKQLRVLARWVMEDGYVFEPNTTQPEVFKDAAKRMERTMEDAEEFEDMNMGYAMRGVAGVFTFFKPVERKQDGEAQKEEPPLKIQIMASRTSVAEILINFHSTCVMNFITHDTAYSLYPRATFDSRLALVCPSHGPPQDGAIDKYFKRGWAMIYELPTDPPATPATAQLSTPEARDLAASEPSFVPGTRWIDDHHAWVLPLPPLPPSQTRAATAASCSSTRALPENSPLKYINWQLAFPEAPVPPDFIHEGSVAKMRYCLIRSALLSEVYMLTDELLLLHIWGALKGVRSAQKEIRKVLKAANVEHPMPGTSMHDGIVYSECETYRASVKSKALPQTLWKNGPPEDPLIRM